MPCADITETLEITLDTENRLTDYKFQKRTCGFDIGSHSILLEKFRDNSLEYILALKPELFIDELNDNSEEMRFLFLKHLLAIQSVLETYRGYRKGSSDSKCVIESVGQDKNDIRIKALVKLSIPTENIVPCGCYLGNDLK